MKRLWPLTLLVAVLFIFSACSATMDNRSNGTPSATTAITPSTNTPKQTIQPKPTATPKPVDGLKSDGKIHVYLAGRGEKVSTPDSSFIDYITYYANSKHLIICMNGKEYVFANVSSTLWSDFKSAESAGKFYNQHFRDNSYYHINDYDGSNGNLIVLEYID